MHTTNKLPALLTLFLVFAVTACGGKGESTPPAPLPTSEPRVADLKRSAEQRIMPQLTAPMQEWVKAQAFYTELTQAEFDMLDILRKAEKAAIREGISPGLTDTLNLLARQSWVQDGLSDEEATNVRGLFLAYEVAPTEAENLESTITGNLIRTVPMPESGAVTVLVGGDVPLLLQPALDLTVRELPKVETLVGKYPYSFVFIWVTDLGEDLYGLSSDQFIALGLEGVTSETVAHELTHSTLYGIFPTWFEEGFAYFMEAYVTDTIAPKSVEHRQILAALRLPTKLDVGVKFDHNRRNYFSASSQGFLFFNGLYEIEGIEGLGKVIRSLRSKNYVNDNELLRAIVASSSPANQQRIQQYLCDTVIGIRNGTC